MNIDPSAPRRYCTELARGGELFDLLVESGPPDEANTAALMKALVEAVAFVHLHGIIHGDIKVLICRAVRGP